MWSSRGHLKKARLNKAAANLNGELIEGTREMAGRRGANPVDECKYGRRRALPSTVIARHAHIAQTRSLGSGLALDPRQPASMCCVCVCVVSGWCVGLGVVGAAFAFL